MPVHFHSANKHCKKLRGLIVITLFACSARLRWDISLHDFFSLQIASFYLAISALLYACTFSLPAASAEGLSLCAHTELGTALQKDA